MKVINRIALLSLGMALTLSAFSKDEEFKKEWHQTYAINADATFKLTNKFGNVHITTWDQNSIQVDVQISVDMKSESKAQAALEKIEIKDESSASQVEIETDFGSVKGDENTDLSVDYTIKLPKSVHLDLRNDFGDLFVGSMDESAEIRVDYGSFRAEELAGNSNKLTLKFSAGEVDAFNGEIEVEYGAVSLDNANALKIRSSFSALDIDHVESLDVKSQYDALEIDEIGSLKLDANFTTTEVDELSTMLDADVEYGGLEVDKVSSNFKSIEVDAEFGGIEISFEDGASYTFNASANMGDIDYPSSMKITDQSQEILSKEVSGTMGSSPGSRTVKITAKHGAIEIN